MVCVCPCIYVWVEARIATLRDPKEPHVQSVHDLGVEERNLKALSSYAKSLLASKLLRSRLIAIP